MIHPIKGLAGLAKIVAKKSKKANKNPAKKANNTLNKTPPKNPTKKANKPPPKPPLKNPSPKTRILPTPRTPQGGSL